ncbi:hypothetical protein G6F23_015274 [Rhizopus arrhizus]|nr:hypothetical protein G6F23_015274 [Rhizopus arrhizus]
MRGTVKAQADPGMVADQPDRQLGVCHVHADLFAAQQPQKRGEGGHERHHAGGGQAGRRRHHVLLGNAELHVAVRPATTGCPACASSISASER